MLAMQSPSLLVVAVLLGGIAQAETLRVGPDPEKFEFTEVSQAIGVAQDGDLILVAPGSYNPFLMQSKSVSIHGSGSDQTFINILNPSTFGFLGTAITVLNSNNAPISLGGFTLTYDGDTSQAAAPWVAVTDCDQSVELFDLNLQVEDEYSTLGADTFVGFVRLESSRRVHLSGIRVQGGAALALDPADEGTLFTGQVIGGFSGLFVFETPTWIADSYFEGSTLPNCLTPPQNLNPIIPGSGLIADSSIIVASNTTFIGSNGQPAGSSECPAIDGAAGIRLRNGASLRWYGGPEARIVGGSGFEDSIGGPGAWMFSPSELLYADDVFPEGGVDGSGGVQPGVDLAPPFLATAEPYAERRPGLIPSGYFVSPGSQLDLSLNGKPDAIQFILWNEVLETWSGGLPLDGVVFVNPQTSSLLGPVSMDATGAGGLTVNVPAQSAFLNVSVAFQSVEFDGQFYTTAPPVRIATRL